MYDTVILGAGLSGLSFAHFSGKECLLLEKEATPGGLCKSFGSPKHDIGPHIFFSKDKKALEFLKSLTSMQKIRRANFIYYKDRLVRYPFENDLYSLPKKDREYCLKKFLNNSSHKRFKPKNMHQWFLKTFGEGITESYLEPYNSKLWKCHPSEMNTQMVERIPNPPEQHIIDSAKGKFHEGYTHQLYFWYPKSGGANAIINGLIKKTPNAKIVTNADVLSVTRLSSGVFTITYDTGGGYEQVRCRRLVSTIPLNLLIHMLEPFAAPKISNLVKELDYVSLYVTVLKVPNHDCFNALAVTFPDPNLSFHRITKLNFLGESYSTPNTTYLMVETSQKKNIRQKQPKEITDNTIKQLKDNKLIPASCDVTGSTKFFKFAYPIYNLEHKTCVPSILKWIKSLGILTLGRFGTWEYLNTDAIVTQAKNAVEETC